MSFKLNSLFLGDKMLANNPARNEISPTLQKLSDKRNVLQLKFKFEEIFCNKNKDNSKNSSNIDDSSHEDYHLMQDKTQSKLERILEELKEKERDYIKMLGNGIKNYVEPIEGNLNIIEVPEEIQNQKFKLFGSIEDIYKLHQSVIYPKLLECNNDVQLIAKLFINLIKEDSFYSYIIYAINFKQAERLLLCHSKFFNLLKRVCNDDLGVQNFAISPIQKISRYALYFEQLIRILAREMQENKDTLASLCVATKNIERLLKRLNEALTINDIIETHELSANLQCGLITLLQIEFGTSINERALYLVPSSSKFHPYRKAINIFKLGKFIMTKYLKAHEEYSHETYPCKIFLFEKSILVTKIIKKANESVLSYRDHFIFPVSFSLYYEQKENALSISDTIASRHMSFTDDTESMQKFVKIFEALVKAVSHPESNHIEEIDENLIA